MSGVNFIIGHNNIEQGSKSCYGFTEFSWNSQFFLEYLHDLSGDIVFKDHFYKEKHLDIIKSRYWTQNHGHLAKKKSVSIELHFNAFDHKTNIDRAEILCLSSEAESASVIAWDFKQKFQFPCKIVEVFPGDRGYANLKELESVSSIGFIIEPFFGDTPNKLLGEVMGRPGEYASVLRDCRKKLLSIYNI